MRKLFSILVLTILFCMNGYSQSNANYEKFDSNFSIEQSTNDVAQYDNISLTNSDITRRRGWAIAGADAAGALGGAGSVASIASWFSWTPAAPVAAIAVGIGAIVGGVGTSLAVGRVAGVTPKDPSKIDYSNVILSDNYFDQVGNLHNRILFDYYSKNKEYSIKSYYDFLEKNKSNYGIKELNIKYEYLEAQDKLYSNLSDIEIINKYTIENLPTNVDKSYYTKFLNELADIDDKNNAIKFIKNFEQKELVNSKYDDKTKGILGGFFSTYRHSLALWY